MADQALLQSAALELIIGEKVSSQLLAFPTTFGPKPRYNPRHPSLARISHKVRQLPFQIPPSALGVDTAARVVNERVIQKLDEPGAST